MGAVPLWDYVRKPLTRTQRTAHRSDARAPGVSFPRTGPPMTAPHTLLGQLLDGKYRLDALLGSGGMGVVFRATHLQLARQVALKLVHGGSSADPRAAERFGREAQIVARLHHPHIVTIFDFGVAEHAGAYFVMELLDGRSLREELEARGRLAIEEAVEIGRQTCQALQAAHAAGVLHRDIKPENI